MKSGPLEQPSISSLREKEVIFFRKFQKYQCLILRVRNNFLLVIFIMFYLTRGANLRKNDTFCLPAVFHKISVKYDH